MVPATSLPRPRRRRSRPQGRAGPGASAARAGRRGTGARGAAVTATSWGGGRVDDHGGRGGGPLQERRQIRCRIVFARTRTHREGILTPGRRRGQRPAAPPGPEMHQQRPASILFSPATCPVFRRRGATSPCRRRADAAAHSALKGGTNCGGLRQHPAQGPLSRSASAARPGTG